MKDRLPKERKVYYIYLFKYVVKEEGGSVEIRTYLKKETITYWYKRFYKPDSLTILEKIEETEKQIGRGARIISYRYESFSDEEKANERYEYINKKRTESPISDIFNVRGIPIRKSKSNLKLI